MNSSSAEVRTPPSPLHAPQNRWLWALLIASIAIAIFICRDTLTVMVEWWQREEYSHGFIIPLVAIFLFWQKLNQLPAKTAEGSWIGTCLLTVGLLIFFVGELSALYTVGQYGFLACLIGASWAFLGTRSMRLVWAAFFYLIFMIPLPEFLYANLSSQLQLLSSAIGVAIIRLFDISVHLDGNIIDLGPMQLQVAEACSGLRYLFPLMSFGFLVGYLYQGPLWQRAAIFLSAMPITVLMNSFRIGLIGVTVDKWGLEMAEGFLHDFEGWVVFMGCVALLFLEIALFQLFSKNRRNILSLINLDIPRVTIKLSDFHIDTQKQRPFLVGFILLLLVTPYFATLNERVEVAPGRQTFAHFPLSHQGWIGRENSLDKQIVNTLQFSDYITADYRYGNEQESVNLYTAWYASQKKGASIHSPRSCIPGGGWRIESIEQRDIPDVKRANGDTLRVNRAVISMGSSANIVYYWFEGRGRVITNEYAAKWYIFWDSLTQSRSDGALIRVVVPIVDGASIEDGDKRLQHFIKDFYPLIPAYVP